MGGNFLFPYTLETLFLEFNIFLKHFLCLSRLFVIHFQICRLTCLPRAGLDCPEIEIERAIIFFHIIIAICNLQFTIQSNPSSSPFTVLYLSTHTQNGHADGARSASSSGRRLRAPPQCISRSLST